MERARSGALLFAFGFCALGLATGCGGSGDAVATQPGAAGTGGTQPSDTQSGAAGTGDTQPSDTPPTVAATSELLSEAPRVSPDASEATRAGTSEEAFGVDLLQVLDADSNLAFSPHSISTAFAMLSGAATDETLTEIANTLHFGTVDDQFHRSEDALALALASRNRNAVTSSDPPVDAQILNQSNDIWIRNDSQPSAAYLDTLAEYYGAGVQLADFANQPEQVRLAINDKVSTDTHGLIPSLIPAGDISEYTVAVLTNALYFKAPWAAPFSAPTPQTFHLLDGSVTPVDTLSGGGTWQYYAGDGFVSVAAPYYDGDLELMLIVPDLGMYDAFRAQLTSGLLDDVVAQRTPTVVAVGMPTFTVKSVVPAAQALNQLGMQVPFKSGVAEFPALESPKFQNVYLSDVLHQATVTVDENGTEASAATAVVTGALSVVEEPQSGALVVNVDRPFLFALRDNPTGALLFLGQVVAP